MNGVRSSLRYEPRLRAIEALNSVINGSAEREDLEAAARAIESVDEERARPYFWFLSALLRALAFLVCWAKAIRSAEPDAARFLVAGKQVMRDYHAEVGKPGMPEAFSSLISRVDSLSGIEIDEIVEIAKVALRVPTPILLSGASGRRSHPSPAPEDDEHAALAASRPTVVILEFSIGGEPLMEPHLIKPGVLYDLTVRASLSSWPEDQDDLVLVPMHVEPPGSLEVPALTLAKPADLLAPIEVSATGRLCAHVSLDFPARPLEVTYATSYANASNRARRDRTILEGQIHLHLQAIDPARNPMTGIAEVDQRLLEIRRNLRSYGVSDDEVSAFLTVLGAAGRVAALSLAANIYPGDGEGWPESRFQGDFRDRLRSAKEIGLDLEEHPRAGGGITDLSFRRIRLELKVSSTPCSIEDVMARYASQLVQYVSGSDRRTGLLVVLEMLEGRGGVAAVGEDIELMDVSPRTDGSRPILIGVVVIRGNLPRPSSLL